MKRGDLVMLVGYCSDCDGLAPPFGAIGEVETPADEWDELDVLFDDFTEWEKNISQTHCIP